SPGVPAVPQLHRLRCNPLAKRPVVRHKHHRRPVLEQQLLDLIWTASSFWPPCSGRTLCPSPRFWTAPPCPPIRPSAAPPPTAGGSPFSAVRFPPAPARLPAACFPTRRKSSPCAPRCSSG